MSAPSDPPHGFTRQEWSTIRACFESHRHVPGGAYLTSGKYQTKGANSLIERGLLTKSESQPSPTLPDCIVVSLTQQNWDDIRAIIESETVA